MLAIDLFAVTDADDQDAQHAILDNANDAIVAYAVSPVRTEFSARQRLAVTSGIRLLSDLLVHEVQDAPGHGLSSLDSCRCACRVYSIAQAKIFPDLG